MTLRIKGKIRNFIPVFQSFVDKRGMLVLQEKGKIPLTVDTGFNGSISLPDSVLKTMDVSPIDVGVFRLATGDEVELPVYWGKVHVSGKTFETWFVQGDALLGMEFLSLAGSVLTLDFKKENVKLAG